MTASPPSTSLAVADPSGADFFQDLRLQYERADEFCKEVQAFVEEAGIPAINELRYAGYHLLRAVTVADTAERAAELTKAINHCHRASYEAAEAGILTALDTIALFRTDYRDVVITDACPHWPQILSDADAQQGALKRARARGEDRSDDYELLINAFRQLSAHCTMLAYARDELNKVIRRERRETRRFVIGVILALATIVISIVIAF